MWDPGQYLRFGDERSRAFFELTARIQTDDPALVVDLGCGPGQLTATLASRWPGARVHGVDSSAEMIAAARQLPDDAGGRLTFSEGDLRDWRPATPPDVIVCNAALQWVPGQAEVLRRWAGELAPGGWLAVQVPGNFDQPSHVILRELAGSDRWRALTAGAQLNRQSADPAEYVDLLGRAGCAVDAWETTYLHVLPGEDPVLEWYKGTGLRPVLAALDPAGAKEFTAEYGVRLREAYPRQACGTVLPFRRVFGVARRLG